jgi:hypothetical protein
MVDPSAANNGLPVMLVNSIDASSRQFVVLVCPCTVKFKLELMVVPFVHGVGFEYCK